MKTTNFFLIILFTFGFSVKAQNDSLFVKGKKALQNSEIELAINYFNKGLQLNKNAEDTIKARYLLYLGNSQKLKLDYKNVVDNYFKAQNIYEKNNEFNGLLETYVAFAEFYRASRDEEKAMLYLSKAEKIINKKGITQRLIAKHYNRKAAIYNQFQNDFNVAINASNRAIENANKIKDYDILASSYNEIGNIYEKNKWKGAEVIYLKALNIFESQGNKIYYCNVLRNIVNVYMSEKKYDKALALAFKGIEIANKNKILVDEMNLMEYVHKIYYKQGKTDLAYQYFTKHFKLREAYREIVMDEQIEEIEKKYEFEKKEKQIQISNLKIHNQNLIISQSKSKSENLFIILLVLSLSGIPIILLLIKSRRDNIELKKLNQQNLFLVSESNHRINNNLQLLKIFIDQELKESSSESNQKINKILSKVNSIALLHKHLYKVENKEKINIKEYLSEVCSQFDEIHDSQSIDRNYMIDSIEMISNDSLYLGLLLTELLMNSNKYAFVNQTNKLISLKVQCIDNNLIFDYRDSGSGIQNDNKPKLIDLLSKQLKSNYTIKNENGFHFNLQKKIN